MFNNGQYDLENKEISVKTGIEIDGNIEYVPMGTFVIEKPTTEEVSTNTQFIGYDYMIKFNSTYIDRVTYPIKVVELLEDLCKQVGVECAAIDFVNSNYMILGNPFTNNEICKTVLSNIAQLAGGFAYIGRDNKLYIKTLKNEGKSLRVKDIHSMNVSELNNMSANLSSNKFDFVEEKIDGDNYFEFSKNNKFGEVNSLILRLSQVEGENTVIQDEDSIAENGLTEITIADNYFLINQEEREKVITELWKKLKGLEYLPFEVKDYGFPYLDLGDMICINDTEDNAYISYVFDYTFEYNGVYSGNLKTKALTKTQTALKNTNNIKTKFRNVEYKVHKIEGKISSIIEQQDEHEEKLTKVEQDVDGIKQNVKNVANYKRDAESVSELHITDAGKYEILKLEIKGNKEFVSELYPRTNLFPRAGLQPNQKGG